MKKKIIFLIAIIIVAIIVVICSLFINKKDNKNVGIEYNFYKYYSNEQFGLIDREGNILIEANYQDIVIPNPKYGIVFLLNNEQVISVVNEKNEKIFTQYEKVSPIPVTGLIGEIPYEKNALLYEENGKKGLINLEGKKITKPIYNTIESLPYKEGEFLAKSDSNVYILSSSGKEKIKLEKDVDIVADGYLDNENSNLKSGYLVSKVTNNGLMYGFINYKGKKILDMEYDKIERLSTDEPYLIVRKNGKYGLCKSNEIIINYNYQEMTYEEDIDLIFVKRGNMYGALNLNGNVIVPVENKEIEARGIFIETLTTDGERKAYALNGKLNEEYLSYNSIEKSKYDNTYIAITNDYTYKILDNEYKEKSIKEYDYIENILPEMYLIREKSGKYGILNSGNTQLVENKYDIIQLINNTELIQAMDINNNITSLYNKFGNKIFEEEDILVMVQNEYVKVFCNEGVKYFTAQGNEVSSEEIYKENNIIGFYENGKWGFKNRKNEIVVEAKYDRIVEINKSGFGGIKKDDLWGVIDSNGNIIVEPKFYIDDNVTDPEFLNKFYKSYYASIGAFYIE